MHRTQQSTAHSCLFSLAFIPMGLTLIEKYSRALSSRGLALFLDWLRLLQRRGEERERECWRLSPPSKSRKGRRAQHCWSVPVSSHQASVEAKDGWGGTEGKKKKKRHHPACGRQGCQPERAAAREEEKETFFFSLFPARVRSLSFFLFILLSHPSSPSLLHPPLLILPTLPPFLPSHLPPLFLRLPSPISLLPSPFPSHMQQQQAFNPKDYPIVVAIDFGTTFSYVLVPLITSHALCSMALFYFAIRDLWGCLSPRINNKD